MGHGPGRPVNTHGRPHGHSGRRSSSSNTPHLMGSGPGRPVKTHGPPHGPGGAAYIEPISHGPRPGPAIKFREDGPRPGPTHQNFRGWAAAGPSPSHFIFLRPGPAHQICKSLGPARPGPAHHIFKSLGPARPGPAHFSDRPGPGRRRQTAHDKPWNLPDVTITRSNSRLRNIIKPKILPIGF